MRFNIIACFVIFTTLRCFSQVEISVQTGHTASIKGVKFSDNNEYLASFGEDNKIVIWNIKIGKQYCSINTSDEVSDICFLNDSIILASTLEGKIKFWNFHTLTNRKEISIEQPVGAITLSEDKNHLFFGCTYIGVINLSSGTITKFDIRDKSGFNTLRLNRSGNSLAAGGRNSRYFYVLQVNDITTKPVLNLKNKYTGSITGFDFSDDGTELFISFTNGKLQSICEDKNLTKSSTTDFQTNSFNSVAVTKHFVLGATDKSGMLVFDRNSWHRKPSFIDHSGKVTSLAVSRDGELLATAGSDHTIFILDAKKIKYLKHLKGKVDRINSISFSQNGNEINIGYSNGVVRCSDLISGTSISSRLEPGKVRKSLGWSYAVSKIKSLDKDKVAINFYKLHQDVEREGEVYNQVNELFAIWDKKEKNKIVLNPLKKNSKKINSYIKSVKNDNALNPFMLYGDSNLISFSKKLQIVATATEKQVDVSSLADKKNILTINPGHTDRISSIAINEQYNMIATAAWDGMIKFWNLSTGALIATYGAFGSEDFIFLDKDNNYFASKGTLNFIAFRYAKRVFPFDQFDLKFNRPDIVLSQLPFASKEIVGNFEKAYKKRISKLKLTPEQLEITDKLPFITVALPENLTSKDGRFDFSVKASDENFELESLITLVNGVPEGSRAGKKLTGRNTEQKISLELNPGANYIQVFVTNSKGQTSLKESFNAYNNAPLKKSDLYLVLIGVSKYEQSKFNLKYADKDATDLGNYFSKNKVFEKVNLKPILNNDAKIETITSVKNFIATAKPNDVVMFFIAGHGVLDKELDYYLATSNMDFNNPAGLGMNYEALDAILETTPARNRMMFIDACHSGEVDKDEMKATEVKAADGDIAFRAAGIGLANLEKVNSLELAKSVFADFRSNNGAWVISSAGATEYAIEGGKWNNGVFTYALLKGLTSMEADLNHDKKIMLSELNKYLVEEVKNSTQGKQKPNARNENLFNDIRIK
jgi:WD40 repeat protein